MCFGGVPKPPKAPKPPALPAAKPILPRIDQEPARVQSGAEIDSAKQSSEAPRRASVFQIDLTIPVGAADPSGKKKKGSDGDSGTGAAVR